MTQWAKHVSKDRILNRHNKESDIYNQKETDDISESAIKERTPRKFNTHKVYRRQENHSSKGDAK